MKDAHRIVIPELFGTDETPAATTHKTEEVSARMCQSTESHEHLANVPDDCQRLIVIFVWRKGRIYLLDSKKKLYDV